MMRSAGLLVVLSFYYAKAKSVEKSLKYNMWKRDHYHIQVNISLEREEDDDPGIDHTVTEILTTTPYLSKPPTTPLKTSPTTPQGNIPSIATTTFNHGHSPTTSIDNKTPITTSPVPSVTTTSKSKPPTTPPAPYPTTTISSKLSTASPAPTPTTTIGNKPTTSTPPAPTFTTTNSKPPTTTSPQPSPTTIISSKQPTASSLGQSPTTTIDIRPSTTPTSSISSSISSSGSTARPFDWQPEYCENLLEDSAPIPTFEDEKNQPEFIPGPPFTPEEIEAALKNTTVPDVQNILPCRTVFYQNESASRGVVNPNWPFAVIPYEIEDTFTNDQRQMIIKAMDEIINKTCFTFPPKENHTNWMRIRLGASGSGCYARGKGITGGEPPIIVNLAHNSAFSTCIHHGVIVHEILHVAGLAHEHTRLDRDNYVTINWENIKPGDTNTYQFCKVKNIDTGHAYDYDSVMHYGAYGFSIDYGNLKTIDAKGNAIGQRNGMSQGDTDQLNFVYCNQTRECKAGWQQFGSNSKQYCFVNEPMTWYSAHAYCQWFGSGAQLAILDTTSLREDVQDYMKDNTVYRGWVGAKSRSDGYYWENGNQVASDSWDGTEAPTVEDNTCVYTDIWADSPNTLKTLTCTSYYTTTMQIICEK